MHNQRYRRPHQPDDDRLQPLTVSSKGQITISADARRKLSIDKGTHLLEIVAGECLVYVPEHVYVNQLLANIRESLRRSNVTVEQLIADLEAHREEVLREFYPGTERPPVMV